jgi:amino acid permease
MVSKFLITLILLVLSRSSFAGPIAIEEVEANLGNNSRLTTLQKEKYAESVLHAQVKVEGKVINVIRSSDDLVFFYLSFNKNVSSRFGMATMKVSNEALKIKKGQMINIVGALFSYNGYVQDPESKGLVTMELGETVPGTNLPPLYILVEKVKILSPTRRSDEKTRKAHI